MTKIINIQPQGKIFKQLKYLYNELKSGFFALPKEEQELKFKIKTICEKIQNILANPTKNETNRDLNLLQRNSKILIKNLESIELNFNKKEDIKPKITEIKKEPVKIEKKSFLRNLGVK